MFDIYPGYPDLMNVREVAEILNCKSSTVCKLCRTKELTAMKVGKAWSIPQNCLSNFILHKADIHSVRYIITILNLKS